MKYLFFCLTLVLAEVVCNGQTGIITTVAGTGTLGYTGDGIAATGSELSNPVAVATDRSGNFYISDQTNHRIRMVNTSGVITTIAGNGTAGYSGDGLAATNAEMHSAVGLIVDSAGNVYFVDEVSMVVRKINTSGIISTVAGNGTMGYSGDGTAASAAQLHSPTDVTMDAAGNLFIADAGNNCVRKVNTAGIISTVAGNGSSGFSADGTLATNAVFNSMGSVAVDVAGNIYIADGANPRIRKVNT